MPRGPVLVIDDDADVREALQTALADEGHDAAEVSGGSEALDYLRTHPAPALLLLDWNMAPMNGAQFLAELARVPAFAKIPVVLVTADARAPDKTRGVDVAGYVTKPIDLDALYALLLRYTRPSPRALRLHRWIFL